MAGGIAFLFLLLSATFCSAVVKQSLNGDDWVIATSEAIENVVVPGGIFSDLMDHGVIEDVFFGYGDSNYSYVGESDDWVYNKTFTVDEDLLARGIVNLVFEGVDTFATVYINDNEVGSTENMFVRYVFNIKEYLEEGDNTISVKFISSVTKAQALADDPSNTYVVPPECPPPEYHGICHANRIRKMQSSYSWDWGPAFASVGIWKNVYLEAFDDVVINYVVATPVKNPDEDVWTLLIKTYFEAGNSDTIVGTLNTSLKIGDRILSDSVSNIQPSLNEDSELVIQTSLEVSSEFIEVWWPNGYGTQSLYNLTVAFSTEHDVVEKTVRVGFRTVELVQDEIENGLSFYFKVNGHPIFAKGANEIPVNILPERGQDPKTVRNLLQSAKDVHMNMLRVWGGGVYESDYFYDVADELGILIWQDFMFACAMYPTDEAYLANVRTEVDHQLKRLGSHPSIAIWSGNNENEGALIQDWYGTGNNFDTYKKDYITLYVDLIETEVTRILPNVNYVTSSPTNGLETDEEGYVARNPGDAFYGDVHFYDYSGDSWKVSTFPTPRFSSEFGYQSMPSLEAWLTATDNVDDLKPDSDFLTNRQHHPGGNNQNLDLIGHQLELPDPTSDNYVKAFIYFSQVVQAQSVKTETEHYRSFKGRLNDNGQGDTMGALYWQLNDVWVAPTWAGIDYTGRWKILHYQAKDFFSPAIVTGQLTNDDLDIYAVFDGLEAPSTGRVLLHIFSWDSFDPRLAVEYPITPDPLKSVLATTVHVSTALQTAGCGDDDATARKNCFFHLHLLGADNNVIAPTNYVFPEKLKNSSLANANVEISEVVPVSDTDDKQFEIIVTTDAPAVFVWLDSHEITGRFTENGFLQIEPSKTLYFIADEPTTLDEIEPVLTVTHVRDPAYL